jgi:hypothetical protein
VNYIQTLAWSFAVSTTLLLTGCMGASDATEPSVGEAQSAIQLYNVRNGPGFEFNVKYQLPGGVALTLQCSTTDGANNTWYKLADGGFILSSIVSGNPSVSPCGGPGTPVGAGLID